MSEPNLLKVLAFFAVMLTPFWATILWFLLAVWKRSRPDQVASRHAEVVHKRVEARRPRYAAAIRSNGRRRKLSRP